MKPQGSTAAEVLARLAQDPEFVSRQKEREAVRLQRAAVLKSASKPLMDDLMHVGIERDSVWSGFGSAEERIRALPILRRHLEFNYPVETLEGIARALAIPQAAPYLNDLITMFRTGPPVPFNLRYALGLVIAATTTSKNLAETIELIKDKTLGQSRISLLRTIRKLRKRQEIKDLIAQLMRDPDLSIELASWK